MPNPFRNIRLVYRRTALSVKTLVLAALVLSTLSLVTLRLALMDTEKKLENARAEAQVLEQENDRLRKSISQLGTVQSVQALAKELLGLVDPDTVIVNSGG